MNRQCLLKPIQYKRIMFLPALLFGVAVVQPAKAQNSIELHYLSSFSHGAYAKQASEVVAHDAATQRLFVVNSQNVRLDVLDIRAPETPKLAFKIDAKKFGGGVNSVDVHAGLVAVALRAWLANIEKVDGTTLQMRWPRRPRTEALARLRVELRVLLVQLVVHKQVTVKRLQRLSGLPEAELEADLGALTRMSLVRRDERDVLHVDRFVAHLVTDRLRAQGMLA